MDLLYLNAQKIQWKSESQLTARFGFALLRSFSFFALLGFLPLCGVGRRIVRGSFGLASRNIAPNGVVNLAPVHRNFLGRLNSEADFVATDFHHNDRNVIINDNALVLLSGKDQHINPPMG